MAVRFGSTGFLVLAEVASIIGIVGCAAPQLRLDADAEPPGMSYQGAFDRWTREGTVVSLTEFDTSLVVTATLRSRAFQRAYADRYLKVFRVEDPAERTRIEKEELQLADTGLNFWVRTAAHSDKWNDLSVQRGRWRIMLIVEPRDAPASGGAAAARAELLPAEVTAVTRGEQVEVAIFGQRPDVYRRLWHLRFPPLQAAAPADPSTPPPVVATASPPPAAGSSALALVPPSAPSAAPPAAPPPAPSIDPTLFAGPRKLTLRFAGPEGKTDLVWLVE